MMFEQEVAHRDDQGLRADLNFSARPYPDAGRQEDQYGIGGRRGRWIDVPADQRIPAERRYLVQFLATRHGRAHRDDEHHPQRPNVPRYEITALRRRAAFPDVPRHVRRSARATSGRGGIRPRTRRSSSTSGRLTGGGRLRTCRQGFSRPRNRSTTSFGRRRLSSVGGFGRDGRRGAGDRSTAPGRRRALRRYGVVALFISPWLIGFFAFTLYPALASLYYSFTNFKILQAPQWIGLDNYAQLLRDPLFWKSLGNTLYLTLVAVPLAVLVATLDRAPAQPQEHARDRGLPDDLLPARRDPGGRRRHPLDLPAEPVERAGQPAPRLRRHRRTGLVLRSGVGEERDRPPHGLGRGRRRDHLSRGAPGRVPGPVRSRRGGRRRCLGEAPPRDDPDDQPGDPVQPHRRRHRRVPVLHPGVRDR